MSIWLIEKHIQKLCIPKGNIIECLHATYPQTRKLLASYKFCHHVETRAPLDTHCPNTQCALILWVI